MSPFARQLQSTYSDLSRVDLDLPVGLLVGLGYAATCPDSPLDFRQAQSAAERSGVASPHCWSVMLPTSARVAQEVYEPLIGIQYPMLCSRLGDTWQIGTTSIREDHLIASGLRFVQWRHASPNIDARKEPKNNPTVKVYQLLEDELARARAGTEGILALTTTREAAQNLRNYFEIAWKTANAETAVKVAGATAQHCIVIHGESTFLSGEGRNLDYDQECLTILACPLNMQGMPGALQVLAALLHGVQSIDTYDDDKEPVIRGSLDLTPIQVEEATAVFHQALMPHQEWSGPLPVCLAEHHQGKVRRLRLILATLSHLTKAEISSLQYRPHLPGGTTEHGLVYGYAVDEMPTPEWLVITDGQEPGHWRLLHNSTGRGQRCSVGNSQRYQPSMTAVEQRTAQDYTFEALRRIYFYDAWRAQPVLGAPESDLVLPPHPGLLTQGCYWPPRNAEEEVLSVSDIVAVTDDQACQTPTSPEAADAVMTDEEANDIVSVLSSSTVPSTLPSTVHQDEADSPMGDKEAETNPLEEAGDCLSNRPASSSSRPVNNEMLEENGEDCSAIPPQGVNPQDDSSPSHSSESPIKRRPGLKASAGRGQSKKLRQSADQASQPPLGSIPEHGQQTVTLEDLADPADQMQESPVSKDPASPSEQPEEAQKHPQAMTEIDLDNDQKNVERGSTAATDIQLEAEQRAMQALHALQVAFGTAADADTKGTALPSLQLYSDLPREWPMARLCVSNKQVNRLVRTFLWRRVAESALHGTPFGNIPEEINRDYIADLHRISEAFAAPLANPVCICQARTQIVLLHTPKAVSALCEPPLLAVRPLRLCLQVLFPQ